MPLTADRTTVKAAVQALVSAMRTNLSATPPTATKPFRKVDEGPPDASQYPRPFLSLWLTDLAPESTTQGDKVVRVKAVMKLVTDVFQADPHDALLDKVGAVDDYFDSLITGGAAILEGADGFENRAWSFAYPLGSTGGRLATAECELSFVVKVERGFNRVPKN